MRVLSFRMPLRFLRGSYSRLALTVIAIACGVALVCAIDLCNRAVLRAFTEVIDTMAGRAALQVTAGGTGLFPEDIAEKVAAVPGVELAVPVVSATAFLADEKGELLTIHGVDVANESTVRAYQARDRGGLELEDPLLFLNQPDSVILTRAFAVHRHLSLGGQIKIETPKGRRTLTIRGLLDPEGVARVHGGNLAIMDLPAAQAIFARPGFVNQVDVVVERNADVAQVAEDLRVVLPEGLRAEAPSQRKVDLHRVMRAVQMLLQGLALIALVAAFLITFNRLATILGERIWALGVLRAAGVRVRTVWRELLKESLVLGVTGVLLGVPLGIGLARLLLPIIATTTAVSSKLIATDVELGFHLSAVAVASALGLTAAFLAAALPAWRTARGAIVETLRSRGTELPPANARRTRLVGSIAVTATLGAIAMEAITTTPAWGVIASASVMVSAAVTARLLVTGLVSHSALAVMQDIGPTGRLAIATLGRNPRRVSMTVATLSVGFGTVFWLWIVAQSFERSVLHTMPGVFRGDLAVSSVHLGAGFVEAPMDEQLVEELRTVPGVAAVVGEQAIDWHYGGGPIAIQAVDQAYFEGEFGEWPLVGGRASDALARVARGDGVLISTNFAFHLGTRAGDTFTLDTPRGPLAVKAVGLINTFLSPRGTVVIARELYKRHWNDPHIVHALIRAQPTAELDTVRTAISRSLGSRFNLRVFSVQELVQWLVGQVRRAFGALYALAALVFLVVLVGIADTLAAGVAERTREIGVLRAVGVARRHVQRMVLMEGAVMGLCGLGLASAAGLLLGTSWVKLTFPALLGWVLDLHVPLAQLVGLGTASLIVCLVASFVPARRAARLRPAVALRWE